MDFKNISTIENKKSLLDTSAIIALLKKEPTWEFKEHAHDIIDVSWHANS